MLNNRFLGLALALSLVPAGLLADDVALNPAHPDRYVVQRGDTLWDISERFLLDAWRWPDIWEVNPQIRNPHLIYPGDEVVLTFRDGKPVLQVRRNGRPTVKLSPTVRVFPVDDGAIPTIPVDAVGQFLARPRVVTDGELERAPYVVSLGKEHLLGGSGQRVFARGLGPQPHSQYTVYRPGPAYVDPDSGETLGYQALHVADAALQARGDPATLSLLRTTREVRTGDRLIPVTREELHTHFMPRAPGQPLNGRIIAVLDGLTQIGQYQTVVLNVGAEDGIEAGHVMEVYQSGILVRDRWGQGTRKTTRDPEAKAPEVAIELDPEKQRGAVGFGEAANDVVSGVSEGLTLQDPRSPFSFKGPRPYARGRAIGDGVSNGQTADPVGNFVQDPVGAAGAIVRNTLTAFTVQGDTRPVQVQLPPERAGVVMVYRPFDRVSYALVMNATRAINVLDAVKTP